MKERLLLRKTCSIYANDLHFATVLFPYIAKEIENNTTVRTILERDEKENIEKIIKNVGLNSKIKEKIRKIDWEETNIEKIRKFFNTLEKDIKTNKNIDIILLGKNIFIEKVNKAIDLWVKNNIERLEKSKITLNIVNCFSFEENRDIENIYENHDYILKTIGVEEIIKMEKEKLLKAN